jgi:hypothetical protein
MAVWKTILTHPNYQVSNTGKVRNKTGQLIYVEIDRDGYERVSLYHRSVRKHKRVHILVAQAFHKWNPGCDVNHKDRDKRNNHADNLECLSHADNMRQWMIADGKMRNLVGELIEPICEFEPF